LTLIAAVVIVPTVMRSRQRIELRDSTRLSIRLNWQSGTPPQKDVFDSHASDRTAVTTPAAVEPETPCLGPSVRATDQPLRKTPFDNAPDLFRGPPSLFV
jgi:hypothetical protein